MFTYIRGWIADLGLDDTWANVAGWVIVTVVVSIVAIVANYITKTILLAALGRIIRRTKTTWDDALLDHKVLHRLSNVAPALVFYWLAGNFGDLESLIQRLATLYMIFLGGMVVHSFLNAVVSVYRTLPSAKDRPIKGYVQIVQIFIWVLIAILIISITTGQSPVVLLSGLGALTAVLLLVFKDTILGLVASFQITTNNMVRLGDWIEMPKYSADGDVIDISLHTIKIQNWDKTISTIPAYALISDSFKNWRGMEESGGRRIKRALHIDMSSIKFCNDEMIERFSRYQYISEYIKTKTAELATWNKDNVADESQLVNGRRLTNVGTFRAYIVAYLRNHPKIHQQMTFLVRQLPPGSEGLPIEIYVFSNDQQWVAYEDIQADIFDHILAVAPEFDLAIFQHPTGQDFQTLGA